MNFLNLPDWEVVEVKESPTDYHVTATIGLEPKGCPHCRTLFEKLHRHGTYEQDIADLPSHGKRVTIHLKRKRYRCQNCGKTLLQPLLYVDERRQMTSRLALWVGEQSIVRTFASVAKDAGLDEKMVRLLFDQRVKHLEETTRFITPEWLGIDELHLLGKARCVLTNPAERTIIGVLEDRTKKTVLAHFEQMPDRDKVKVVTMDMARTYADVVRATIPHAAVVVDKFHVVRMASVAMETVRKSQRDQLEAKFRRKLMHDRFILLSRPHDLRDDQKATMESWFQQFPTLAEAYRLKEAFYRIYDSPDKATAIEAYGEWERSVKGVELTTAFRPLLTAMRNWQTEVFAYWEYPVTNAITETLNGIAKAIARNGRGYSFKAIRAKMLFTPTLHKLPPTPRQSGKRGSLLPAYIPPEAVLGTDVDALLAGLLEEAGRRERPTGRR